MNNNSIYLQQFQMKKIDVQTEISKINKYLNDYRWMDFDYGHMGPDKIVLYGCTDQSYRENAIEITFEYPQMISTLFNFSMDETSDFIQLANPKELLENTKLYSEEGYYIFQINSDDI